jgi:hypothetical protein
MENEEDRDEKSKRVNIRIPTKQYNRMMTYAEVLGLDTDSAVLKHFLNLGLQFGGASLAAQISSDTNKEALAMQQRFFATFLEGMQEEAAKLADQAKQN